MQVYPSSSQGEQEEVSEPVGRRAASSFPEAATPGPRSPPAPLAPQPGDDISPHSQRGASLPGNAGGASGRRPPRELTSAPICSSPPHPTPPPSPNSLAHRPAGLSGPARARQAAHPPCSPNCRLSGGDGAARAGMRARVCMCVGRPGGPRKADPAAPGRLNSWETASRVTGPVAGSQSVSLWRSISRSGSQPLLPLPPCLNFHLFLPKLLLSLTPAFPPSSRKGDTQPGETAPEAPQGRNWAGLCFSTGRVAMATQGTASAPSWAGRLHKGATGMIHGLYWVT